MFEHDNYRDIFNSRANSYHQAMQTCPRARDDEFHAILSLAEIGLHHSDDKTPIYREIARVLKPAGIAHYPGYQNAGELVEMNWNLHFINMQKAFNIRA